MPGGEDTRDVVAGVFIFDLKVVVRDRRGILLRGLGLLGVGCLFRLGLRLLHFQILNAETSNTNLL